MARASRPPSPSRSPPLKENRYGRAPLGRAPRTPAVIRSVLGGALAMAATYGIGSLAPPRPRPPARASITGITTPEPGSRTICVRARAKLAVPGCLAALGCAVFVVGATARAGMRQLARDLGLRCRVQQNPVTRAAPGAGTVKFNRMLLASGRSGRGWRF
jgi:hypothetical protein